MKKLISICALCTITLLTSAQPTFKNIVGQKAPAIEVKEWLSAKPKTKGKFIIIDFWATWCGPCRKAIPHMNAIYQKFKNDIVIIGLSGETAEKVKAMTTPVIEYYSAVDPSATTQRALEIRGIPNVMVIDPHNKVVFQGHPMELTDEMIQQYITNYQNTK